MLSGMRSVRLVCVLFALAKASAQTYNCTNVVDWNFFGSKITQNNLGGFGPGPKTDAQEIRYSHVSDKVDLVVTVDTQSKHGPYRPKNVSNNGFSTQATGGAYGEFGQINIYDNSEAAFKFQLVVAGTDTPLTIAADEKVHFSIYDLDSGGYPNEHEYVQFITPVVSHGVSVNTTVAVSGQDSDGTLYAESGRRGDADDNPTDPLRMSKIAEESKISVTYVGQASWEVLLGHKDGWPPGGRNLLFAGRSQGDCACIGISDWTLHENLQHNNLGGKGPVTTDPPELRYSNVFKTGYDQQPIDMVVRVADGSTYDPANTTDNGLWPAGKTIAEKMGQVNIRCGTETTFDFMFFKAGTDNAYNLSNVLFSVFDLDQHANYVNHEYVIFPNIVTNWTLTQDPPTEVLMSGRNDGTLRFTSTQVGNLDDNPTDPRNLTPLQKSRSVTVWDSDASQIQVTFGHEYGTGVKPTGGGRNVLFAGPGVYCPASSHADTSAMLV